MSTWKNEIRDIEQYYNRLRGKATLLENELKALGSNIDEVAILLYARRILETIVTEQCVAHLKRERGTEPVERLIDRLFKEKLIPEYYLFIFIRFC